MWKLTGYEFRKLISNKIFLLVVFLVAGILVIRSGMKVENKRDEHMLYDRYSNEISKLPREERQGFVTEQLDYANVGIFYKDFLSFRWSEQDIEETQKDFIDRYGYDRYLECTQNSVESEEELLSVSAALQSIQDQSIYREMYHSFLVDLPERAEDAKAMAVFSGKNTFSYRSIEKSVEDYGKLKKAEVEPDYDEGVKALTTDAYSFVFVLMLLAAAGAIIYSGEKENGLQKLLLSTRNGHTELAVAKLLTLMLFSVGLVILTSLPRIIIVNANCGYGNLNRTLQSVQYFRDCSLNISVLGYLVLSVLMPCLAAVFACALLSLLYTLFRQPWVSLLAFGGFTAVQFACYRLIGDQSMFNLYKFVNLFSFSDVTKRLSTYTNVNVFGHPVSVYTSCFAFGVILSGIIVAACLLLFDGRILSGIRKVKFVGKKPRVKGNTSLLGHEFFRLNIAFWGILFLVGVALYSYRENSASKADLSAEEYEYYLYGTEISGEVTPDLESWLSEKQAELDREQMEIYELGEMAYQEGSGEGGAGAARSKQLALERKMRAFSRISAECYSLLAQYQNGYPVHYISEVYTDYLFQDIRFVLIRGLLMLLLLSFSFCKMFSDDLQTGMNRLVSTTLKGRLQVFLCRYAVIFLNYTAAFLMMLVPVIFVWTKQIGMSDFSAPIQSLVRFSGYRGHISIRSFCALWVLGSYSSGFGFVAIISCISRGMKRTSGSLIVSCVIIIVDFLIGYFRFPVIASLVLSSGFSLTDNAIRAGSVSVSVLMVVKNIVITAGVVVLHAIAFTGGVRGRRRHHA